MMCSQPEVASLSLLVDPKATRLPRLKLPPLPRRCSANTVNVTHCIIAPNVVPERVGEQHRPASDDGTTRSDPKARKKKKKKKKKKKEIMKGRPIREMCVLFVPNASTCSGLICIIVARLLPAKNSVGDAANE